MRHGQGAQDYKSGAPRFEGRWEMDRPCSLPLSGEDKDPLPNTSLEPNDASNSCGVGAGQEGQQGKACAAGNPEAQVWEDGDARSGADAGAGEGEQGDEQGAVERGDEDDSWSAPMPT
jgi:hypothetical protein